MVSRHNTNRPKWLDKVWVGERCFASLQPNGYVVRIDWRHDNKLVHVKFLDCKDTMDIPLSDFKDNYAGHDQWLLSKLDYECHVANVKAGSWNYSEEETVMPEPLKVDKDDIDAITELVQSGDIDLAERRKTFKDITEKDTSLTDIQLTAACAATTDDDELMFVEKVRAIEAGGYVEVEA